MRTRGLLLLVLVLVLVPATLGRRVQTPTTWEALGPFAWGMRELGGDPLEAYGGIANLPFPATGRVFASELADGAQVAPSTVQAEDDGTVVVAFPAVRWEFNRQFFGWTANQWQAWVRGAFTVESAGVYGARCASVGEFWIDAQQYHGDWYSYGEMWSRVELAAGTHLWRARLASEMRLFGGALPPTVRFRCELVDWNDAVIVLLNNQQIVPDVLASSASLSARYVGIGLFNPSNGAVAVFAASSNTSGVDIALYGGEPTRIASGQSRRIALELTPSGQALNCPLTLGFTLDVQRASDGARVQLPVTRSLPCRQAGQAVTVTFVDFDGSVQYTMVKPPLAACPLDTGCPPILTLHGAGVEANSAAWTNAYPQQPYAWVVYPTGRTPWGYDWHGASRINAEYALQAAAAFAGASAIDSLRVFLSGHSNGGQGCWHVSSHFPDRFVGANPAAGFVKIQLYVPFYWRPGDAHADPMLRALLESGIAEFDSDLYAPNLVGLPLIARTGGADDNVPPVHSRRLVRMLNELNGGDVEAPPLSEVAGAGHYYDGIMTDGVVGEFLEQHTRPDTSLPAFPQTFSVITLNPASSGYRGNLLIQQLRVPARAARIHVQQLDNGETWQLRTENVRRFRLGSDVRFTARQVVIDGTALAIPSSTQQFCRLSAAPQDPWQVCPDECAWCSTERSALSSGPILQVYDRAFVLIVGTRGSAQENAACAHAALTIANDWCQFGNGNVDILTDEEATNRSDLAEWNLIILGGPAVNSFTAQLASSLPVVFDPDGRTFSIGGRAFVDASTGVLFTAPWKMGLAVVASGIDATGIRLAVEQFPVRTGATVPDFVVVGPEQVWKAAGGVLAAGFWTYDWQFSEAAGYLR